MCETLLQSYKQDPNILEQMWFSDEAVFHISGQINRYIIRFWGKENLVRQRISKIFIESGWLVRNFFCWLIMSHFFKNDAGVIVNVS